MTTGHNIVRMESAVVDGYELALREVRIALGLSEHDEHEIVIDRIKALCSAATASEQRLVMADGSPFADYLRNAVPEGTPMDEWTNGYETCKRRLAAILLPQMEAK